MIPFWFAAVCFMFAMYVVLDGFDLGVGICHLHVARGDAERRRVLRSIGPFWDGNEVWLVAGGGLLFCIFPGFYAASFAGFYLPFMLVLWLLVFRALAIELRGQLGGPIWPAFWDAAFALASLALTFLLGVALGNVVRGVPLDERGDFFLPLWDGLTVRGAELGVLDPYTALVGLTAVAAFTLHGALWLILKTDGAIRDRSRRVAMRAGIALVLLVVALTGTTLWLQPNVWARLTAVPTGFALPTLTITGLTATFLLTRAGAERGAFFASCAFQFGLFASAAFGIYPYVLPSSVADRPGMTAADAAAGPHGLHVAVYWWVPGILLVITYTIIVHRIFRGKTPA